jgi:hypothetical protein
MRPDMATAVKIKQPEPPAEEVPAEILATSIVAISEAMDRLMQGRLNASAVYLLIQNACPSKDRPTIRQIETVLQAARDLKKTYVRPNR